MPSPSPSENTPQGLFSALKACSVLLLESGKTRFALLANEFVEEKQRVLRLVLFTQAALFCLAFALLFGMAWFVLAFWEQRLVILGGAFLVFVLLAFGFYRAADVSPQPQKDLFSASLNELEEDIRQLKTSLRNEPPTQ